MPNQQQSAEPLSPAQTVTLPPLLREFCVVSLVLSAVSVLYCVAQWLLLHHHYPYDWPLFDPVARFSDFTIYQHKFELLGQPAFWTTDFPFTYPAPMGVLYAVFFKALGGQALHGFLTFMLLSFVVPAVLFWYALRKRGLSVLAATVLASACLLLSWPAALLADRGNVEVFVWVALLLGTWAYARGKEWTAAVFWGVAASLKLFPFVFLVLFLTRTKFTKLLAGAAVFGVVTLASLATMGPTVSAANRGIADGLSFFKTDYMTPYRPVEQGLDHSLYGFIKTVAVGALRHGSPHTLQLLLKVYLPLSAVGGVLLYFLLIRRLPWRNQLLILTIVSIYFTAFSGDGTLMHLYYGFALCCFVAMDAWRRKIELPGLRTMFWCFAFLLSTESFFIFHGRRLEGQAKCIALGVLLFCAFRYPLGPPVADATEELPALPDASRIRSARAMTVQAGALASGR